MRLKLLFLSLFLILWTPFLLASSFEICEFKIKVIGVTKTQLKVDLVETIVSPGFNAEKKSLSCQGKINKGRIPLDQISQGKSLAVKGAFLKAEWRSYSAMGENGPVSSHSWSFYALPD